MAVPGSHGEGADDKRGVGILTRSEVGEPALREHHPGRAAPPIVSDTQPTSPRSWNAWRRFHSVQLSTIFPSANRLRVIPVSSF